MSNKYFTIYWRNGDRSVIQGPTIDQAFTNAGYGAGAMSAVDWYDNGVTETHSWDKDSHSWIEYMPIRIHHENEIWDKPFKDVKDQLVSWLIKHQTIIVDFDNRRLELKILHRTWKRQYVKHITLVRRLDSKGKTFLISLPFHFETFFPSRLEDSCKALYERVLNGGNGRSSVQNDLFTDIVSKQLNF